MIEMGKQYRTGHGDDVRILCTDGPEPCPVIGYRLPDGEPLRWTANGAFRIDGIDSEYDLIEVKPKIVRWLNLYSHTGCVHQSREQADDGADDNRIACIRIEFEEGEGLEK